MSVCILRGHGIIIEATSALGGQTHDFVIMGYVIEIIVRDHYNDLKNRCLSLKKMEALTTIRFNQQQPLLIALGNFIVIIRFTG